MSNATDGSTDAYDTTSFASANTAITVQFNRVGLKGTGAVETDYFRSAKSPGTQDRNPIERTGFSGTRAAAPAG